MTDHIFYTTNLLGKKWTIMLLDEVEQNGEKGFNHLMRQMKKISSKVLAQRLEELEQAGLIKKTLVTGKQVKRTTYHLTPKGQELQGITLLLKQWYNKHSDENLPNQEDWQPLNQ